MTNRKHITIIMLIIGMVIIITGALLVINGFNNISKINAKDIATRILILILGLLPFSLIILLNLSIFKNYNTLILIRIIAYFWLLLIFISCIIVISINILKAY